MDPAAHSSFPLLPFSFCLFSILGPPVVLRHEETTAAGQTGALKLDGGVGDAKFFSEALANISQELFALLHVHVWDANVAGERVQVGAERPDVNVVDLLDARDAQDGVGHFLEHHIPGQAFEQDVSGFFQDTVARPQHQHADGPADGGVHPVCAGRADDQGPGKYADVGEGVAKIVNQHAAQVEVAAAAQQGKRDAAIHGQRSERNPDHQVIAHCLRVAQASDRKSTRLNSSYVAISYAVFCLKKKT